jgi:hypothetical protein
LLAKHGPRRAARSRGPTAGAGPNLSTGHGHVCATHGRGPDVAAELQWTCGQQ